MTFRSRMAELWNIVRLRARPHRTKIVVVSVLGVGLAWFVGSLFIGLPSRDAVGHIGDMDQATTVYDDHDHLAFTIFKERRIEKPLDAMSIHLVDAILAVEDQRFFDHGGFDVVRMLSAAMADLRLGRAAQGGSTITQQLARQSFLTSEKTLRRKVQELILAQRIEHLYSKPRILEMYLNKVYFGDGAYGAEAASQGYFGKHASELSIAEAALLAGLVKSPSSYAPTVSKQRAMARRNLVLQAMLDGEKIDRVAWQAARATPLVLRDDLRGEEPHGQYFKEQVRQELVERFGWQRVYQGGLRVFATIDMPMEVAAEAAVAESMASIDARRKSLAARRAAVKHATPLKDAVPVQGALIALDPVTGQVRAMVGGRDFGGSHFNRAVQAHRQPGSAFKPFVYAAALEAGYGPATVIDNLNDPIATPEGAWTPGDEHSTATAMTLRTGLRTSSNRAAARLLQQVGIPKVVGYARRMGVGDVPSVPSLALGSGEVTLQSMTAAYAAFANHGRVPQPVLIRRVEDRNGQIIYESKAVSTQAISESTAFLMATMMADVINAGTAAGARQLGFTLPAAGKTGTTNDFNDAWFIGFTPKLVAGVWIGFDAPRTILPNGFAAALAVPLWTKFMMAATRGNAPEWFTPPGGVTTATVCRVSGKLATDGCDDTYLEYFASGTAPTTYCDVHPTRGVWKTLAGLFGGGRDRNAD